MVLHREGLDDVELVGGGGAKHAPRLCLTHHILHSPAGVAIFDSAQLHQGTTQAAGRRLRSHCCWLHQHTSGSCHVPSPREGGANKTCKTWAALSAQLWNAWTFQGCQQHPCMPQGGDTAHSAGGGMHLRPMSYHLAASLGPTPCSRDMRYLASPPHAAGPRGTPLLLRSMAPDLHHGSMSLAGRPHRRDCLAEPTIRRSGRSATAVSASQ